MKHAYHSLLPVHLQHQLMIATPGTVDATIKAVQDSAPFLFHDETTVARRRFYHEPRQLVPNAGCVVPFPTGMNRA